jgi:hypothetical protein
VKTKENLHRCCLNGGKFRLPMCLIRREEEKGHHIQVTGEVEKPRGAGNHEAERSRTRLLTYMESSGEDFDTANEFPSGLKNRDYQMDG